jgi:endoglucanase
LSELQLFSLDLRMSALNESGRIAVSVDGTQVGFTEVNGNSWDTISLKETFLLDSGLHRIVLKAEKNPIRVEWLEVKPCGNIGGK